MKTTTAYTLITGADQSQQFHYQDDHGLQRGVMADYPR
jgi:hypothetical protein